MSERYLVNVNVEMRMSARYLVNVNVEMRDTW